MKTAKEIYEWLKKQNYQTEIGEQEYRMYYDVDMPKILEQYHEARMKDELMNFQKWYYENLYGLEMESSEEDIINNYLATRKNK